MGPKGFGVVSLEDINSGEFIIEYVGELINGKETERRLRKRKPGDEHFYFLNVSRDLNIDSGPRGNLARFMNHSCGPNCIAYVWSVRGNERVGIFAIKNIPALS